MSVNNNHFQKNSNTSLIASLIRNNPNCSRVEIAKELELYKSTVTNITQSLLDYNVIKQVQASANEHKTTGRKAIGLKLNPKFSCVVGVDLQPSHYRTVIIDFAGDLIWEDRGELLSLSFENVMQYVMKKVLAVIHLVNCPLLAVCLGIPGIVDASRGIIKHADAFNLYNFDLYTFGQKNYMVPFLVENDANCCAWFEIAKNGSTNLGDFMSIYSAFHCENEIYHDTSGVGIGFGLAIDNKVYAGTNSYVGELRSYTWKGEGQTGIDKTVLFEAKNDERCFRVWLKDICYSLIPVVSMLTPSTIFFHGKPFEHEEEILNYIKEDCPELNLLLEERECALVFDNSDDIIVAKGAAMMYLQKLFNLPTLKEIEHRPFVDWDLAFKQAAYKGDYMIKGDKNV